jgi:GH15 family glucan-1,4-alpha-glucosidase
MPLRIEDYALIGDCQTAALVGIDGSIDWLCFPRFDSPACFAALLGDPDKHGRWLVAPDEPVVRTTRRYRPDSLVLETTFETETGAVTVVDCMPPRSGQPDLVRLVDGVRGTVRMKSVLAPRFDYGLLVPWVRQADGAHHLIAGPDMLTLRSSVADRREFGTVSSRFQVRHGECVAFVLSWKPSHEPADPPIDPGQATYQTTLWWQQWAGRCKYESDGHYREAVVRSLITLKALTYEPTGGIVAAPTTSLPEHIGGPRNWDYRYCWLRDSTFTLAALLQAGYPDEARAWREWLLRAVAGSGDQLRIMYGLAGERRLPEFTLDWLPGYENSAPVRIGNAACSQFQLDVYGEVLDSLHLARRLGLHTGTPDWWIERELLGYLEAVWDQPDEGIWEVRGPKRHFTHSKLMAWVAFDRAVKDVERFGLSGPADRWAWLRDKLHADICDNGFNPSVGAFTQSYGSHLLDASLLMMTEVGFLPADDPRIRGTVEAIERRLLRDGFVDRYETESGVDGLPPGEGAFLLCTFWLADNYALLGRYDDAKRTFENLLAIRNDVGLLAEEYDPHARRQLGNFPQAFSHIGLINTARNLATHLGPSFLRHRT